ncbi:hypothetical protein OIO90_003896 [Microbotryomycetes sp. JL221]|nr:hypothetical protein OIO90_003896 [Microbotryomycetes sp. JL221]
MADDEPPEASTSRVTLDHVSTKHDVDTTSDLIAGWLGGAVGILVSNPLEVLKVRLQTQAAPTTAPVTPERTPNSRVGRSSPPATASPSSSNKTQTATSSSLKYHGLPPSAATTTTTTTTTPRPGLATLWKTEGVRFLFAGAAGPILGLAFIDSAFFGLYGRAMAELGQDRQDPNRLSRVFAAGAAAGGICAMLETPIEVVKCRAQVEQGSGEKLGSFKIARAIARKEGLRGFYIGGLMTAIHDGISSGIFFWGYFVFRRMLRGEHPFTAADPSTTIKPTSTHVIDAPVPPKTNQQDKYEILRILLAGGMAGALSAVLPYPFDIIKTRLQTANFEARGPTTTASDTHHAAYTNSSSSAAALQRTSPSAPTRLTISSVARGIHADGVAAYRYRYSSTLLYQVLSTKVFTPTSSARSSTVVQPGTTGKLIDGRPAMDSRAEKWSLRILGCKGFLRGIRPTVISSFVGSAATITMFEVALKALGVEGGGGGVG